MVAGAWNAAAGGFALPYRSGGADGVSDSTAAGQLEVNRKTVRLWRERFAAHGIEKFVGDRSRSRSQADLRAGADHSDRGCDAAVKAERDDALELPNDGASQGISKSTVNNIWSGHNIRPHRSETFKLSRDPKFLEKLTDVVGLYLNPPQQAIVLCVDEKSQIQA